MKKSEIIDLINSAIQSRKMCGVLFKYDKNYRHYFPLKSSERLFLGAVEDDFILDGFSVRRFRDIKKAELNYDKCEEIIKNEGLLNNIKVPQIDLTDWHSVFTSLQKLEKI